MRGKTTRKKALDKKEVEDALIKKALGYDAVETVEEFVSNDGEIVLSKKKVTTKNVPPDVTALKLLLETQTPSLKNMTDEELEQEKQRLLLILEKSKREK